MRPPDCGSARRSDSNAATSTSTNCARTSEFAARSFAARVQPPKSRYGRRKVPISRTLAAKLRVYMGGVSDLRDEAWVFASRSGTPLNADNLRGRFIKPLMRQIGAPWAAWHTLRHTYASFQLAHGANIVQLSRALGHHSASFTLDTYIHLIDGEDADPLELANEIAAAKDTDGDLVALAGSAR